MALNPKLTKDAAGVWWLDFDKDPTAEGYAFTTPGGVSRTFDPDHTHVKIGKPAEPFTVTVTPLDVSPRAPEAVSQPPVTPPPPATGFKFGLTGNLSQGGWFNALDYATDLHPQIVREDMQQNYVAGGVHAWADAHGVDEIVLVFPSTPISSVPTYVKRLEMDNEPYYRGWTSEAQWKAWGEDCINRIKQARARIPNVEIIVPLYVQSDGGDVPINAARTQWKPLVNVLKDQCFDVLKMADTYSEHPYGKSPGDTLAVGDKVRGQLKAVGIPDPRFHCTEYGYATLSGFCTEQQQADELVRFKSECLKRPYILSAGYYQLKDQDTNSGDPEKRFGLLRSDRSKKPAYSTFKALAQ